MPINDETMAAETEIELKDGTTTTDPRLDRLVVFDPRSLDYRIRGALEPAQQQPVTKMWTIPDGTPVLDQGVEGACVGFGVTNELLFEPVPVPGLDARFARERIYWTAQRADPWRGGCVDTDTQCLTGRGWVSRDELRVGDEILAFDIESETLRWAEVEAVHAYTMPYRVWASKSFAAAVTDNHRWAVRSRAASPHWARPYKMVTTETWLPGHEFPRAAPCADLPNQAKWEDDFVELIAWVCTEGSYRRPIPSRPNRRNRGVVITQKTELNRVRALLGRLGAPTRGYTRSDGSVDFTISGELAEQIRAVAPDRAPALEWLRTLTLRQLRIFLEVCQLGDGSAERAAGNRQARQTFIQKRGPILDAWLAATVLAGQPVSRKTSNGGSGRDCETWTMRVSSGAVSVRELVPGAYTVGDVWCPQTTLGTFVARRHGSVFITGNSYPGAYPRYEGTSLLHGVRAAAALGYYRQYRWATSEPEMAAGVSALGPAIIGVNWMQGMQRPDRGGVIRATGAKTGGHCTLVAGIDVERDMYLIFNSWGVRWGIKGRAWLPRPDMARLLADRGECCIITERGTR